MQRTVREFRGIPRHSAATLENTKLLVEKSAKKPLKTTFLRRFWPVFQAEFRGIPRHSAANVQMAIAEVESQKNAKRVPFFAKMAKKLPKVAKQHCCRIFRPDTGTLEGKTPILTERPKIFIACTFLSCRAFCANIRPPPLNFHSAQACPALLQVHSSAKPTHPANPIHRHARVGEHP